MAGTGTDDSDVGLCARCRFARRQETRRGGRFWRCTRADSDPSFKRYPPLPVRSCSGFQAAEPAPRRG